MNEFLAGQTISCVHADTDIVYIMLENGTQITIKGFVFVENMNHPIFNKLPK